MFGYEERKHGQNRDHFVWKKRAPVYDGYSFCSDFWALKLHKFNLDGDKYDKRQKNEHEDRQRSSCTRLENNHGYKEKKKGVI